MTESSVQKVLIRMTWLPSAALFVILSYLVASEQGCIPSPVARQSQTIEELRVQIDHNTAILDSRTEVFEKIKTRLDAKEREEAGIAEPKKGTNPARNKTMPLQPQKTLPAAKG